MTHLQDKFLEAAKAVSSSKALTWESVKQAFVDHLSDISTDSLPNHIQIFFDSVRLRVTAAEVFGKPNSYEVSHIADDIRYIANAISKEGKILKR